MKTKLFLTALTLVGASLASAQTQLGPVITQDTTLPAGSEWLIDGVTYVAPGVTLTIEPGVTVYAEDEAAAAASALIVTSGATINAVGTPDNPIVFTSVQAQTVALDHNDVSLWAGIILLGDALINADATGVDNVANPELVLTNQIEGLDPIGRHGLDIATETAYLTYGGTNDGHSAGAMEYVSIRHTGISLTGEDGDEIQGLTLGGVGSGTLLENIEIFVSGDDGIEIFGGAANLKNIVLAYAEDDTLDLDQGYRGLGQNIVVIQSAFQDLFGASRDGDSGGEWDGADSPETNTPAALGIFSNMTFVSNAPGSGRALRIRNGGANQVWNSVFLDYAEWLQFDNKPENNIVQDAVQSGTSAFVGNIITSDTSTSIDSVLIDANDFSGVDAVAIIGDAANKNLVVTDAGMTVTRGAGGKVTLSGPSAGSPALNPDNVVTLPDNGFFTAVNYVGAFNGVISWAAWTFSAKNGYLSVPGYIDTELLGFVYVVDGMLGPNQWVFSASLGKWIFIASDGIGGSWIYIPS
ncbi:MAG: hypothetical protein AB3N64_05435 [Puniceicoccaceae bacterium]